MVGSLDFLILLKWLLVVFLEEKVWSFLFELTEESLLGSDFIVESLVLYEVCEDSSSSSLSEMTSMNGVGRVFGGSWGFGGSGGSLIVFFCVVFSFL